MPNYKTHLMGGLFVFLVTVWLISLLFMTPSFFVGAEWLLFAFLGSLFPDIDTKSKGQKLFYSALGLLLIFLFIQKIFFAAAILSILGLAPILAHHRGIFHKPWFVILLPFSFAVYAYFFMPVLQMRLMWDMIFFSLGALSHIWLDIGTKRMFRW